MVPRFRLLQKVHSLRLAGKRYFPGDEFELTEEEAERFNSDIFVEVEPSPDSSCYYSRGFVCSNHPGAPS